MISQLIHRIKVRQAEIKEALSVGTPMNWESYQRMVGEFQGLQGALDLIDRILEEESNE
jgi:hypothetical protein